MRKLTLLSLSSWCSFACWFGVFYCFWRSDVQQPHGLWSLASLASVLGLTIWQVVEAGRRLHRDCDRVAVIGWVLIGLTPPVSFGYFWLDMRQQFSVEQTRPGLTMTHRVASTWALSFLEAKAWQQFSRSIRGQHVELIDRGQTPDAQRLVEEMDQHIEAMAALLDVEPPTVPIAWVRGSMFGQDGRAVGRWSLCGRDGDADSLTQLDRHEAAHSLVFSLSGPDEDTPSLLMEGWAESQSNNRDAMILSLANEYQSFRHFRLDELTREPWHLSSHWPVYSHGGPFALFLIEQFTPGKFFEVYCTVQQDSFHADIEEILGTAWPELEAQFWQWLVAESKRITDSQAGADVAGSVTIEFAEGVDVQDWQRLVDRFESTQWDRERLPRDVACVLHTCGDNKVAGTQWKHTIEAVFEGESCWLHDRVHTKSENDRYLIFRRDVCAEVTRSAAGDSEAVLSRIEEKGLVRSEVASLFVSFLTVAETNPGLTLPLKPGSNPHLKRFRCKSLTAPTGDLHSWRVQFRAWFPDETRGEGFVEEEGEVWLDDVHQLAVQRLVVNHTPSGYRYTVNSRIDEVGSYVVPAESTVTEFAPDGSIAVQHQQKISVMSDHDAASLKQKVEDAAARFADSNWNWIVYSRFAVALLPIIGLGLVSIRKPG